MKSELETDFKIPSCKVSVIPFGINNTTPRTGLTRSGARKRFGLREDEKILLFFGQIAPYKGLEYLVDAIRLLAERGDKVRLVIAGKIKSGHEEYWSKVAKALESDDLRECVTCHARFVPDTEVEGFMLIADAVVLPYKSIFQSGVPFLAYSFGVPVIATDVGSLRDDIIEGRTGYLAQPCDSDALADVIVRFFASTMYRNADVARSYIAAHANERHSWALAGQITEQVYRTLTKQCKVAARPAVPSSSVPNEDLASRADLGS